MVIPSPYINPYPMSPSWPELQQQNGTQAQKSYKVSPVFAYPTGGFAQRNQGLPRDGFLAQLFTFKGFAALGSLLLAGVYGFGMWRSRTTNPLKFKKIWQYFKSFKHQKKITQPITPIQEAPLQEVEAVKPQKKQFFQVKKDFKAVPEPLPSSTHSPPKLKLNAENVALTQVLNKIHQPANEIHQIISDLSHVEAAIMSLKNGIANIKAQKDFNNYRIEVAAKSNLIKKNFKFYNQDIGNLPDAMKKTWQEALESIYTFNTSVSNKVNFGDYKRFLDSQELKQILANVQSHKEPFERMIMKPLQKKPEKTVTWWDGYSASTSR